MLIEKIIPLILEKLMIVIVIIMKISKIILIAMLLLEQII